MDLPMYTTQMDNLKTQPWLSQTHCKLFSPGIVKVILSRYLFLINPFFLISGHLIVLLRYRNTAVLVTDSTEEYGAMRITQCHMNSNVHSDGTEEQINHDQQL